MAICGQEIGTKKESLAAAKQYPPNHTLMIGDAPGDYKAAVANKCLFFPINPGAEEASWQRLLRRRHRPLLRRHVRRRVPDSSCWPSSTRSCPSSRRGRWKIEMATKNTKRHENIL